MNEPLTHLATELHFASVDTENSWEAENYIRPYSWLYLVEAGTAIVERDGQTIEMKVGSQVLVPLNRLCHYRCTGPTRVHGLAFNCRLMGAIDLLTVQPFQHTIQPQHWEAHRESFQRIRQRALEKGASATLERHGLLTTLLAHHLQDGPGSEAPPRLERFLPILSHIEKHLADPLDLRALARMAHCHPTYFSNEFSRLIGTPPRQYINQKRMAQAQWLLINTRRTVKEVALQVGFQDPYYFSRLFRKMVGVPPTEVQRSAATGMAKQRM
ncbi:MAG: helix-turn-helix transcriptional regulator [Planctomycetota bacterium]|jgi:AraC-like DNA-binding protein